MPARYRRIDYLYPEPLEDELVAGLWAAGTVGVEQPQLPVDAAAPPAERRLVAWFREEPEGLGRLEAVWARRGAVREGAEWVAEADWLAPWRERSRPFAVGERLWIDPREPEEVGIGEAEAAPEGRRLLRLPARRAFGVGSHESTRLAVRLLERLDLAGARVLDVGTGSGILAFAALAAGARSVTACDLDPVAAIEARDNARRNRLTPHLFAGEAAALSPRARFELVLLNIVPELVLESLPEILRHLAPPGPAGAETAGTAPTSTRDVTGAPGPADPGVGISAAAAGRGLIFSGILAERGDEVIERVRAAGTEVADRERDGDWVAFRFVPVRRSPERPPGDTARQSGAAGSGEGVA